MLPPSSGQSNWDGKKWYIDPEQRGEAGAASQ